MSGSRRGTLPDSEVCLGAASLQTLGHNTDFLDKDYNKTGFKEKMKEEEKKFLSNYSETITSKGGHHSKPSLHFADKNLLPRYFLDEYTGLCVFNINLLGLVSRIKSSFSSFFLLIKNYNLFVTYLKQILVMWLHIRTTSGEKIFRKVSVIR